MSKTITFNELRRLKDSLPDGSTHRIADELNVTVQTVRNYFGGVNYQFGKNAGMHIEPGPDGRCTSYQFKQMQKHYRKGYESKMCCNGLDSVPIGKRQNQITGLLQTA